MPHPSTGAASSFISFSIRPRTLSPKRHLLGYDLSQVRLGQTMLLRIELVHFARPVHAAELGPAHTAERCFLVVVVRQGFIVHAARRIGIERQSKLLVPIEGVTGVRDCIISVPRPWPVSRH